MFLFAAIALALCLFSYFVFFSPRRKMPCAYDSPFGVLEFLHWDHSWNSHKYGSEADLRKAVSLMKEARVGWVRMDFLWGDIEPKKGKFDFAKYDRIVTLLEKKGISILGILHYSADWASACGKWNCPPRKQDDFIRYASMVMRRYKGRVCHWELWNEPDSPTYWQPQDKLVSYCLMLKEFYREAKKINPNCKVLNGGLAEGATSIDYLYDNGAGEYFDIMNVHFFQNPLYPGAVKAVANYPGLVHEIMLRHGDGDKRIWITEIGCPGVAEGADTAGWWLGENPGEEEQASWLKYVYGELLKSPYVDKIFWAFFRDTRRHWNDGVDYFGMLRWDFSRKPSFYTYQECAREWRSK